MSYKSELGYSFILTNQNSVCCTKFNFESNKAKIEFYKNHFQKNYLYKPGLVENYKNTTSMEILNKMHQLKIFGIIKNGGNSRNTSMYNPDT